MRDVDRLEAARLGDRDAVESLYHTYARFVAFQAFRRGAGQDAEDVVHEIFLRIMEDRGCDSPAENAPADGSLYALLAMWAHWIVGAPRHARGHRHGEFPELSDGLVPLWAWPQETPEDRALRLERGRRLQMAFASLSQKRREIAYLRFIECLRGSEIEARLKMRPKSVMSELTRIRRKLRPLLKLVFTLPPPGSYGDCRGDFGEPVARSAAKVNYNAKRRLERARARQG